MRTGLIVVGLALAGCTARGGAPQMPHMAVQPVEVGIIGFNDFHGNLEPPHTSIEATAANGASVKVPVGGAAYFASAVARLKAASPNHLVLSAGDMISASPVASSLFLDEPTIHAMNLIGVDYNAVGNHEFDRGQKELLRIQYGGCEKNTRIQPCAVEPFPGAKFQELAANVVKADGNTLFPAYAVRAFGSGAAQVKVGVIGLTLRSLPTLVMQSAVDGLTIGDEAEAVNALVPRLKAQGVDAIVVLIHQGAYTDPPYYDPGCSNVRGPIVEILDRLDPAVDLIVSGHTHRAYICQYGKLLVTSAGTQGSLLTDIRLRIDPVAHRVVAKRAENLLVQSEAFTTSQGETPVTTLFPRYPAEPRVAALVARYAKAAEPLKNRVVGRMTGPATKADNAAREFVLGDMVADAQLAGARAAGLKADLALMNYGGVRVDLIPNAPGEVTFGQIYAVQPFGNVVVVRSYTGAELRTALERQLDDRTDPNLLGPSANLRFAYDMSKPKGQQLQDVRIDGEPLDDKRIYRVAMSNFMANGGDTFFAGITGADEAIGPLDLDALEAYLGGDTPITPPLPDRIRNLTPAK